ncbi:MAG: adenylate/guanylate cyclase domain-containing protein [Limisphaerales bacterium]
MQLKYWLGAREHQKITHTMPDSSIDDLIRAREQKQSELREIGKDIQRSARDVVVAFVDLVDSTAIKVEHEQEAEQWLGLIYTFLTTIDRLALANGGTVVKRIGDELMLSFADVAASESFLDAVEDDTHPSHNGKSLLVPC